MKAKKGKRLSRFPRSGHGKISANRESTQLAEITKLEV
jgi:hypothetical protein